MPSEDNIKLIFGVKLKHLRLKKQLIPQQLAEKAGISNSYLNEIEKGKKYPKTDKISALATALQVKYDDLVSLKLPKEFAAFELLLHSNFLNDLPLELLGIDLTSLSDILTSSPTKINAFLNTIVEIARNHDLQTEYFYFSVLRSYQEIQDNYFEDVERSVEQFLLDTQANNIALDANGMKYLLQTQYAYHFDVLPSQFKNLRSIFKPEIKTLFLNEQLNEHQLLFVLGRELAFEYLRLQPRPWATTYFNKASFTEIFNNFVASYFATALLLPQERVVADLKEFFTLTSWNATAFDKLADCYGVSSEMFMHRLTNLLPKFFKLNSLFFLRLSKPLAKDSFNITKELHLGRLHNPHASSKDLHYCRRWVSLQILNELENKQKELPEKEFSLVKAQISNYTDSKDAYFIISVARPMYPVQGFSTSVSIGMLMNDVFKKTVAFADDAKVPQRIVSETCETCQLLDCKERVAEPSIYNQHKKLEDFQNSLDSFLKK